MVSAQSSVTSIFDYDNAIYGSTGNPIVSIPIAVLLDMVNTNLDYGHPVMLGLDPGHAILADGYGYYIQPLPPHPKTLYHHLNMGWAGLDDAWYNFYSDMPPGFGGVWQCIYNIFVSGDDEIISGRVTDINGNAVEDATVTAEAGVWPYTWSTTTNDRGIYALAHLPSNTAYTISAAKAGFVFGDKNHTTGKSTNGPATTGNIWGVDFVPFEDIVGLILVDAGASGDNDGSSWDDAYNWLADAIAAATSGSRILVAQGTYKPDQNTSSPLGSGDRYATFRLKNGVTIYGGFPAGGCNSWDDCDPNIYETILDGDIGAAGDSSDNSVHVVLGSSVDATAVLDGFTVTDGDASGEGGGCNIYGGGMYNTGANPTVKNCTFRDSAGWGGGGMCNDENSSPTLINCLFISNDWENMRRGGGMWNRVNSNPTLIDCTFGDNSAGNGGGMCNENSSPTLTGCSFNLNSAWGAGGGMYNKNASPMLVNCTFSRNLAEDAQPGGGMYNSENSAPMLINCVFSRNSAQDGGGIYNYTNEGLTLTNCLFSGNLARDYGGGMYHCPLGTSLTNCTFTGNFAYNRGGGIHSTFSGFEPLAYNCIFWGNDDRNSTGIGAVRLAQINGTAVIKYSCIQGGWPGGIGNISADPCFVEPTLVSYPISHWKLDEDSGTTAGDSVNGNDGTISGAAWTTGKVGPALYFDGSDNVTVSHSANLDITGPITIEAWIKAKGTGTYLTIVDKYEHDAGIDKGFSIYSSGGKLRFTIYSGANGAANAIGTSELRDDQWHHVAGLWDGGNIKVYVDGVLEKTSPWAYPPASTTNDLGIGKRLSGWGGFNYFLGTIDEVAIYDEALSGDEIQQHYQDGLAGLGYANVLEGDCRLLSVSPCVDAGDNTGVPDDIADLDGDANTAESTPGDLDYYLRFVDGDSNGTDIVDMGAYEFAWVYIHIGIGGDLDDDGDIDFGDFSIFAPAWLTEPSDDGWNPDCDISVPANNSIDMLDLAVLVDNWLTGK